MIITYIISIIYSLFMKNRIYNWFLAEGITTFLLGIKRHNQLA